MRVSYFLKQKTILSVWNVLTELISYICQLLCHVTKYIYVCRFWHFTHTWKVLGWPHHLLRGQAWAHSTSLTSPLFSEVPVPSQEIEQLCICVLGYFASSFYNFDILFCNCSDGLAFFTFQFIKQVLYLKCNEVICHWGHEDFEDSQLNTGLSENVSILRFTRMYKYGAFSGILKCTY